MKYKDIDIDVNQETKEKLVQKRKERTSFIISLVVPFLILSVFLIIIPIIVTICSPSDERFETFAMAFAFSSVVLFVGLASLISMANYHSKKRIKYLPLNKETMQKLNVYTVDDYCNFLNEFLLVTPTGKEAKEGSLLFGITEIPKEILEEINGNFPVEDDRIAWDDFHRVYFIIEKD